jgi:hypothetical protein
MTDPQNLILPTLELLFSLFLHQVLLWITLAGSCRSRRFAGTAIFGTFRSLSVIWGVAHTFEFTGDECAFRVIFRTQIWKI